MSDAILIDAQATHEFDPQPESCDQQEPFSTSSKAEDDKVHVETYVASCGPGGLLSFSRGYEQLDFSQEDSGIISMEWPSGVKPASLIGGFSNRNLTVEALVGNEFRVWKILLPNHAADSAPIAHDPLDDEAYVFEHPLPKRPKSLRIYASPIGMSGVEPVVNTCANFKDDMLSRNKWFDAVQARAIHEHSYFASFGYNVTTCFAPRSHSGTPEELKSLMDKAHELGLFVLGNIVHNHVSNIVLDGLNLFEEIDYLYSHFGTQGYQGMWVPHPLTGESRKVLRFLPSNARCSLEIYMLASILIA